MTDESAIPGGPVLGRTSAPATPAAVDRAEVHLHADRQRPAHLATGVAGWAPHRPVAAPGSRKI
jgi:hypothetical protein